MMWRQLRLSSQAKSQANKTSSQKVRMWLIGAEAGNGRVEALTTEYSAWKQPTASIIPVPWLIVTHITGRDMADIWQAK